MSELSKNKRLKKLYDFGDRITPQKWAKAIDILSPESIPEDAPVINTTYEEAKTLYESGGMKQGVYYRFKHTYTRYKVIYTEDEEPSNPNYTVSIYIKVFIADDKLKAIGTFYDYDFIADYSFESNVINVTIETAGYGDIYDSKIFSNNGNSLVYYTDPFEYGESTRINVLRNLIDACEQYNISYSLERAYDYGEGEDLYWETTQKDDVYDSDERIVYKITILDTSIVYTFYSDDGFEDVILLKKGLTLTSSENTQYKWIVSDYELTHTGLLSNLDFGDFKYSYLIGGNIFIGDVDIKLEHHINFHTSNAKGYIKNSDITGGFGASSPTIIMLYSSYNGYTNNTNVVILSNIMLQDISGDGSEDEEGWEE